MLLRVNNVNNQSLLVKNVNETGKNPNKNNLMDR